MRSLELRTKDVVIATAVATAVSTALIAVLPSLRFAYRGWDLHIALVTAEAMIVLLCSYLLFGRVRRRATLDDVTLGVALVVLGLADLLAAVVPAGAGSEGSLLAPPSALVGRLLGTALLAAAALVPSRRVRASAAGAAAITLAGVGLLVAILIVLSVVVTGVSLPIEGGAPELSGRPRLEGHPAVLVAQLVGFALAATAAIGFTIRSRRTGDPWVRWLAVAAVVLAAARVNYLLYPASFSGYVYTGDVFELTFYLVVLVAATGEIRSYWRHAAEVAALEERRRIARDLHDGLAQELASVRRNLYWLDGDKRFVGRVETGVERALVAARSAIGALSDAGSEPFADALAAAVRQVAERERTRVVVDLEGDVELDPRRKRALILIACEAVTNAARHGGAGLIRVELIGGRRVRLRVRDFGRGFDPAAQRDRSRHGLAIMNERANGMSGKLRLESHPGKGTLVEVTV